MKGIPIKNFSKIEGERYKNKCNKNRNTRNNVNLKKESKSEQSTHFNSTRIPIQNYLSYTFRAYRNNNKKTKIDFKNYIYDLDNTIKINFDLIKQVLLTIQFNNNIKEKVEKIINLYNKSKEIKNKKNEIKGKILVHNQILEENKRRNEESLELYSREYKEFYNAIEKKDLIIKKLQKRYDEIEGYIQKESKFLPKYKMFKEFEILPFIIENENLILIKFELIDDIDDLKLIISSSLKENNNLKKRNNQLYNNENDIKDNKYDELIEIYQCKCNYENNKRKKLKKYLSKIKNPYILFPINKKNFYKSISNNITEYLNSEKTLVSIISNNNKGDNCIISNLSRLTQKSNKGWDISYIEKKDDI